LDFREKPDEPVNPGHIGKSAVTSLERGLLLTSAKKLKINFAVF
jgi:hypothetical protein